MLAARSVFADDGRAEALTVRGVDTCRAPKCEVPPRMENRGYCDRHGDGGGVVRMCRRLASAAPHARANPTSAATTAAPVMPSRPVPSGRLRPPRAPWQLRLLRLPQPVTRGESRRCPRPRASESIEFSAVAYAARVPVLLR